MVLNLLGKNAIETRRMDEADYYWLFNGVTDQTASVLPDVDLSFLSPVTEYYNRSIGFLNSAELPESTYILLAVGAVVTFYLLYEHHREVRTLIIKK